MFGLSFRVQVVPVRMPEYFFIASIRKYYVFSVRNNVWGRVLFLMAHPKLNPIPNSQVLTGTAQNCQNSFANRKSTRTEFVLVQHYGEERRPD